MNRGALITDLKNMIGPGVEVGDTGLSTWLNDAYMQMCDEIIKVNPDYFVKSSTTATVADQQEYDLPSDFEKIVKVEVSIDGTWKRVLPMGDADIRHITNSDTLNSQGFSTADPGYYIIGDNIGIMPIPDTTTASALKIWYTYTPTELTTDATEPSIPARYHHLLKYGAYANYLDQDEEHVAAERMRQRFDALVARMVENLQDKQTDEVKSVTITQNPDMYTDDSYI